MPETYLSVGGESMILKNRQRMRRRGGQLQTEFRGGDPGVGREAKPRRMGVWKRSSQKLNSFAYLAANVAS